MELLHLDSRIAGARTLWILRFSNQHQDAQPPKNRVELLIPAPFKDDEWMTVSRRQNDDWFDTLQTFQKMCEETKLRCRRLLNSNPNDLGMKLHDASSEIDHFVSLVNFFNQMIKRFGQPNPPPPENPDHPGS